MEKELIVKWTIRESGTTTVLGLLTALVEKTREEKGNLFYNIYQSQDNRNVLILHERYSDQEALDLHKASSHYLDTVVAQIIPHLEAREVVLLDKLF